MGQKLQQQHLCHDSGKEQKERKERLNKLINKGTVMVSLRSHPNKQTNQQFNKTKIKLEKAKKKSLMMENIMVLTSSLDFLKIVHQKKRTLSLERELFFATNSLIHTPMKILLHMRKNKLSTYVSNL